MAVEAPHISLFPPQLLNAGDLATKANHGGFYNAQGGGGGDVTPLPSTAVLPSTYNNRKRSRDSESSSDLSSFFFDQDVLYHFQRQQSEIDRFIAQHTEKVRMELEEQRVRHSRMVVAAIQEAVAKKLKEKDEEIHRAGKLNWMLQERVKSLCVENQIWRDLAQTNQATANSLRNNLEQLLAHVSDNLHRHSQHHLPAAVVAAESSCASNNIREEEEVCGGESAAVVKQQAKRMCSECGERESIVLLLPCRHLCLCTMCGSTVHSCPLCRSAINASVHVNYS
ncbi:hypothetical protein Fmac_005957 [Flemingia macrophylla]|uniref:RING-type domain-containing protein n=1 Tax=Flemingia macrophylla TaxID=520843 RepID=A0ABD1NAE6_9FABA